MAIRVPPPPCRPSSLSLAREVYPQGSQKKENSLIGEYEQPTSAEDKNHFTFGGELRQPLPLNLISTAPYPTTRSRRSAR